LGLTWSRHFEEDYVSTHYQTIDIQGQTFPVSRAVEEEHPNGGTVIVALLRLSPQQRDVLHLLIRRAHLSAESSGRVTVQIQRQGIDANPITVQMGGYNWWSRHDDRDTIYYKQIVRLLPMAAPVMEMGRSRLTLLEDHAALSEMVIRQTKRFELLADELLKSGTISQQVHASLTGEWIKDVLPDAERNEEVGWTTRRVADAEEYLYD
jgi:hypothetical protein